MKRMALLFWRISRADLRLLWLALRHPLRPGWLIPATLALVIFALSPLNFVVPVLGVLDDMVVLPLVLHYLLKFLPLEIRRQRMPAAPILRRL